MHFWLEIAAFVIKALIVVVAIVAAIGGIAIMIARLTRSAEPKDREIRIKSINERYDDMRDAFNAELLDRKERKALLKARKKEAKARRRSPPASASLCMAFKGDMRATAVRQLGARDRRGADGRAARSRRGRGPDRQRRRHGDRLRPRRGGNPSPARAKDHGDRLGRPGRRERRLHDGLRRRPHRRRALRRRRLDRRGRAGRRTCTGSSRRTTSTTRTSPRANSSARSRCSARPRPRAASIFAASSTRHARRVQGACRGAAGRRPTSTASPTATLGSPARRSRSASSTRSWPATNFCSAPATAPGSTKSRGKRASRLLQQLLSGLGVAAQNVSEAAAALFRRL